MTLVFLLPWLPRLAPDQEPALRDGTELRLSRTWREEFETRMTGETGGGNT